MTSPESQLEKAIVDKFVGLKYTYRRAMQQIVEYENDPGNGHTRSQLAFAERTSECSWLHP